MQAVSSCVHWRNGAPAKSTIKRTSRRRGETHGVNPLHPESIPYTRSQRITSEHTDNKSALTDHATRVNRTIDWDNTTIVEREDMKLRRKIRETIRIRQETRPLNRDKGNYDLPHLWGPLLIDSHRSTGTTHGSAVESQLAPINIPKMAADKSSRKSKY